MRKSANIFMPVRNGEGRGVPIPTAPWNKFGYALEFDSLGRAGNLSIDFESVAELLVELDEQARLHALVVARVIVAPEYVGRKCSRTCGGERRLWNREHARGVQWQGLSSARKEAL